MYKDPQSAVSIDYSIRIYKHILDFDPNVDSSLRAAKRYDR